MLDLIWTANEMRLRRERKEGMKHVTRQGVEMDVREMADSHLVNTVNMVLDKLGDAKVALEAKDSKFLRLAGEQAHDQEAAARYVTSATKALPGYIYEMVLRDLDVKPVGEKLRGVLGRSAQAPKGSFKALMTYEPQVPFLDHELEEEDYR